MELMSYNSYIIIIFKEYVFKMFVITTIQSNKFKNKNQCDIFRYECNLYSNTETQKHAEKWYGIMLA